MMNVLRSSLNEEQFRAASTIDGPLLIIAGAGSGKTRMICYRIAHMLSCNIKESNILALTFTNKAATEMRERVRSLVKSPLKDLTVSTFHAFGMRVLKKHIHLLGYRSNFTIYDQSDRFSLLKEVLLEEELDPQGYNIDGLLQLFSDIKTERYTWPSDIPIKAKRIFDAYKEHLLVYNAVDFDDLIMMPLKICTSYPQVLDECHHQYTHILVDEFQDTSKEQYALVSLLAQKTRNICVVGDDDQSIYSWRGANYQNILLFERDFPERIEIKLERNYRSTGTILQAANSVIGNNKERKEKNLWTNSDKGGSIIRLNPEDEEEEASLIIKEIRRLSFEQRLSYNQFCILVRTNHLIPHLENALMLAHIPCIVSGGQSFFERKEVKDILCYLRLLANLNDDIAFLRIINTPRRHIGRTTLHIIKKVSEQQHMSLFQSLEYLVSSEKDQITKTYHKVKQFSDLILNYRDALFRAGSKKYRVLHQLVEEIGYKQYLAQEFPHNEKMVLYRYKSVEMFLTLFKRWEQDPDNYRLTIYDYLQRISLTYKDQQEKKEEKGISLMTMHAAKGLEFDTVFLAGIEDHIIPHARTLEEDPSSIEEERRLFYVALTRARQNLYISSCNQRKRGKERVFSEPSRFLQEIPTSLCEEPQHDRQLDQMETFAALAALRERLKDKESS